MFLTLPIKSRFFKKAILTGMTFSVNTTCSTLDQIPCPGEYPQVVDL